MTPLDVQNLELFRRIDCLPICNYCLVYKDNSYRDYYRNIFLENKECDDIDLQSLSISSLIYLGLLSVNFEEKVNDNIYEKFYRTDRFIELVTKLKENQLAHTKEIKIRKGIVELTGLGDTLLKICLDK